MTAEVAVMNRSAVALAADSAVTLSGLNPFSEVDKIFQNENKLFELSKVFPIGLMIYNAMSFFGIPWEVIIKDFRQELGSVPSDTVFEWADRFRDYLMSHVKFKPSPERQEVFVETLLGAEMSKVFDGWVAETRPFLLQKRSREFNKQYRSIFSSQIEKRIRQYDDTPFYHGYDDTESKKVLFQYQTIYDKVVSECFKGYPLDDSEKTFLLRLACAVLGRSKRDWFTTGLVFAGYGSTELFPSLVSIEIGGSADDKTRWIEKRRVDIDRGSTTAEIIPFAQRETVDTLLFGRADIYERRIVEYFTEGAMQVGKSVVEQLTKSTKRKKDFNNRVEAAVNGVVSNFAQHHSEQLRRAFARDTLDSVRYMPKPDLAAFAESLVTVTSMMRKASIGPETVGGPVDVAVISRHEGFIWVKRKHYFNPELNRRYMWRAFNSNEEGKNDVGQ